MIAAINCLAQEETDTIATTRYVSDYGDKTYWEIDNVVRYDEINGFYQLKEEITKSLPSGFAYYTGKTNRVYIPYLNEMKVNSYYSPECISIERLRKYFEWCGSTGTTPSYIGMSKYFSIEIKIPEQSH